MIQKEQYDCLVLSAIENGEIVISPILGKIYGAMLDDNNRNNRKEIGYTLGTNKCFTIMDGGKAITYPICRAIFLSVHKNMNYPNTKDVWVSCF